MSVKVGTGPVAMFWLFKETNSRLDSFATLVKENKSLDEAAGFCRYVINSRLCDFLDEYPGTKDLPCDGSIVRGKAEKLLSRITRRWETRDSKPHVETSDLVQIRAELVSLRAHLGISEPHLHVIEGEAAS